MVRSGHHRAPTGVGVDRRLEHGAAFPGVERRKLARTSQGGKSLGAIGNVAVMMAALGVFGTGSAWPDLMVAAIMAGLALTGGVQVFRQANAELRTVAA